MFRKIGIFALAIGLIVLFQNESSAFFSFKKPSKIVQTEALPTFAPVNYVDENKVWAGTFQLVWNELINNITRGPVEFVGEKSELVQTLNKQGFNESMISEDFYYKKYGKISFKLKKEIEFALKKKFNDKSDILDSINWSSDGLLIYAILKKDFEYLKEFKELEPADFEGERVKFFGISKPNSDNEMRENVEVLFYENKDSYAVKLITKGADEVVLYRTDDDETLENHFVNLNKKTANSTSSKTFNDDDTIKVPYIKFDKFFEYSELENRIIYGSDYVIDGAIQTVKFKLDNKGGSLKSEAAIIMRMSLAPSVPLREFNFDKPFVLFLKEKNQTVPYFIAEFKNAALFEKL